MLVANNSHHTPPHIRTHHRRTSHMKKILYELHLIKSVYSCLIKDVLYVKTNSASERCVPQENVYDFKVNFFHMRKTTLIQLIFAQPGKITGNWYFFELISTGEQIAKTKDLIVFCMHKSKKVDTVVGVLTLILLSRDVGCRVARYLKCE